ncbi:MAG: hypothetical protein PVF27_05150 [Gemmatimonadales bacterium]|jgi:alpha-mannosidase
MRGEGKEDRGRTRPAFIVPHTHWDREWYEPAARVRQRLVEMLDAALDALQRDERLTFLLDGQTILLEDYLAVRPDRTEIVRALVRGGRLAIGPWYVLADELLSGGETLVRNLLQGRADGERLGGWMPVGYAPDAFGHPAVLPTILRGFGIRHAVVWRGYGGAPGQEGDVFRWRGPDGATALVHHLPPAGYEVGADIVSERGAVAKRWRALRAALVPRAGERPLLVPVGADHQGLVGEIGEGGQVGEVWVGTLQDYFAALPDDLEVPTVAGELRSSPGYTWVLYGVHSTRARLKRAIAEGERLLARWAGPQAALAWVRGASDRRAVLAAAWREQLANTFHDTVCGTTCDEAAAEAAARARRVVAQARGILADALDDRLGQDRSRVRRTLDQSAPALILVNPSPYPRSGVVEATVTVPRRRLTVGRPHRSPAAPVTEPTLPALATDDGRPISLQLLRRDRAYARLDAPDASPVQDEVTAFRVALHANEVPAMGLARLTVGEGSTRHVGPRPGAAEVVARGGRLTGPWCEVTRGGAGGFDVLERASGSVLPSLARLTTEPDRGDCYTHQPVRGASPTPLRWSRPRAVWRGPLVAALAREFFSPVVRGVVYARLDARSRLLRIVVEGDNRLAGHRLRLGIPIPRGVRRTLADMHFGPVMREHREVQRLPFPAEQPAPTAAMHRYVIVPGALTLFTRGLYEYEVLSEGMLAVTLLRSVTQLSRDDLPARPGHAAWPVAVPAAAELGRFRCELAVATAWADEPSAPNAWAEIERLAEEFHAPLAARMLPWTHDAPSRVDGPCLSGEGLALHTVTPARDGRAVVLRCANVTDRRVQGCWRVPFRIRRARRVRLDERAGRELSVEGDGHAVPFAAGPREIVTVAIEPMD